MATDFALAYPDRVKALVLASPGLSGYVLSAPLTWATPVFQGATAGDASKAANPVQPLSPPALGRLAELRCPVLVLLGGQDLPHIADVAALLARGIPGARLIIIPHAGHQINFDAREDFNRAHVEFLAIH